MRVSLVSLLFAALSGVVAAQKTSFTDALASAPKCALTCALEVLPKTTCTISNETCLCHDPTFNQLVGVCVQSSCSIKEALTVTNLTWSACGFPLTDTTRSARYTAAFLLLLPVSFLAMRLASRLLRLAPWGAEDTTIVLAFVFFVPFLPMFFIMLNYGLGKDIWTLQPHEITMFLKLLFVLQLFYIIDLAVIKASILYLYLRVFSVSSFRTVLWCTQVFNFLLGAAYVLLSLVQCQPFQHYWEGWDGEHEGKCADLNKIGLTHVAFNIGLDVWMLVLPATQLYKLNLQRKKKIGVMAMFSVGIFLTIVSIVRIKSLLVFATSFNITAETLPGIIWSYVELCVGIVVACMPAARQVVWMVFPKLVDLTKRTLSRSDRTEKSTESELRPISGDKSLRSEGTATLAGSVVDPHTPKSTTFTVEQGPPIERADARTNT